MRQLAQRIGGKLTGKSGIRASLLHTRREAERRIFRDRYDATDLRSMFVRAGARTGRVVKLQSSWDELYNFDGKPTDIIDALLDVIGPTGTLLMPAGPLPLRRPGKAIDFRRAPSQMGLLTELFRRYPQVQRSVHRTASVCALGPAAEYLVRDHHLTETGWDLASPFGRMIELDALQISLGLYPFWSSSLHCIDAILRHELEYHRRLFPSVTTYSWRNQRGEEGIHSYYKRIGRVEAWRLRRHYPRESYVWTRLSNLRVFATDIKPMVDRGVELARRGITIYTSPRATRRLLRPIVN